MVTVNLVDSGAADAPAAGNHTRRVCDGSSSVRLAIAYLGARSEDYAEVNYELGYPFLYVDGTCRYWISSRGPADRFVLWRPIHTGILSEADERTLADSIHYDDLPAAVATCQPTGNSDAGVLGLYDGEHATGCQPGTTTFQSAEATWWDLGLKLYPAGQSVMGGLRVAVGEGVGPPPGVAPFPWPLTAPIQDFIVAPNDAVKAGKSKRLSDPSDVAKLLALRETYLNDVEASRSSGIEVEVGNLGYVLYFREDLPFTGEDGLPTFVGSHDGGDA